ncbi:hypothetical protein EJB05_10214, partial [Eragrostis curvula]
MVPDNVSCTQPMEDDDDMLSKLPSDVLASILEKLSLRDVIRAGVVSRRWRRLPGQLPRLVINFADYLPAGEEEYFDEDNTKELIDAAVSDDALSAAGDKMLDVATAVLASRAAAAGQQQQQQVPVVCAMRFPLRHNYMLLGRLLDNAIAGGKVHAVELTIFTTCALEIDYDDDDQKRKAFRAMVGYGRRFRALFEGCPATFGGLTSLTMENMTVREAVLDDILTTCTRLELLCLEACDAGRRTTLWRLRHARLADLRISYCLFGAVHLVWLPRLERFAYRYSGFQTLSFGHVPHLTALTISDNHVAEGPTVDLRQILANTAVKDLRLNLGGKDIWVQPEAPEGLTDVFRHLNYLKLRNVYEQCSLSWIMFLLQAAPFLKELYIKLWDHECNMQRGENKNCFPIVKMNVPWDAATNFKHSSLTRITIQGFYSTEDILVTYIRRLVRATVNLEEIRVRKNAACEYCDAARTGFPQTDEEKERFIKRWRVRHARLADLRITFGAFRVVDLVWLPRLERFAYRYSGFHFPQSLSFGHVPHLTTLTISGYHVAELPTVVKLSQILANTAVKDLRLNLGGKDIWVEPEAPKGLTHVFRHLKYLKLRNVYEECSLSWIMFLLQAAPFLKELYIKLWDHECDMQLDENKNYFPIVEKCIPLDAATDFKHSCLTLITIQGLYSTEDILVTYICRLMQAAINLEEIRMRKNAACEDCDSAKKGFPQTDKDIECLIKRVTDGGSIPFKIHIIES